VGPQASGISRDGEQIGAIALDGAAAVAEAPPCAQHENNESSERLSLVESEKFQIEKVGQNQNILRTGLVASKFMSVLKSVLKFMNHYS